MIKSTFPLMLVFAVACQCSTALGQTPDTSASEAPAIELRNKLMYLKMGWVHGLSVNQAGQRLDLGAFGKNIDQHFAEFPEALKAARSFRTQSIVGFTLVTIGLAALVSDVIYVAATSNRTAFNGNTGVYYGLLLGGIATEVAGGIIGQNAVGALAEAVNKYNGSLLNKYLPPGQKIDFKMFVGMNQRGAGLAYHF